MTELATIRKERQKGVRRYTQEEAAEVLGVSRRHYVELEHNPSRLTAKQMAKLAEYFGMEPEEVFFICRGK